MPATQTSDLTARRMAATLGLDSLRVFCLGIAVLCSTAVMGQQTWLQEGMALRKTLEAQHYSQRTMDDKLSEQILFQMVEALDPRRVLFQQSDWNELAAYRHQIDDELGGTSWKFLPLVTSLYKQRLLQADKRLDELTQKPFVFSTTETAVFSRPATDSLYFVANDKEMQQRWMQRLKYQAIDEMTDNIEEVVAGNMEKINAREPAARQKVRLAEKRKIKRILENPAGFDAFVMGVFFNTVAECFDPHSNYFSQTNSKNFEASLATEGLSFGIDLDENDNGDVIISRLVPGGPAWKSNELHKGDVLLELQWEGKNAVDLTGAEADEVEELLTESATNKLQLTVRKENGEEKKVTLVREKIREDENIVKSYILKGEKLVGYIALPGFYTETEDASSLGCANDVAKAILRLKEAKVEGIILDIRYNGGGSLQEGLNLAGIFIDEGPLGIMQRSDRKPTTMKDMNRGTVYDGPLVLMVNGQSASASELLAATLQDYNRAVIVGNTTYGKATGQIVLPLSVNANPMAMKEARSNWGSVKVTVSKLYRVSGKSAQLAGVKPNIYQPDIYESLDYRELTKPYALVSDSVSKKVYFNPLKPLPIAALNQKSEQRMAAHPAFQAIWKMSESLRNQRAQLRHTIVLHPAAVRTTVLETYQRLQAFQKVVEKPTSVFKVENTGFDSELMKLDSYSKDVNQSLISTIQQDFYIEEAYQVIKDLIVFTTHK